MPKDKPAKGDIIYSAFFPDEKNPASMVVEANVVYEVCKYNKPTALIPDSPHVEDIVWMRIDKGMVPWKEAAFSEEEALDAIISFLEGTCKLADEDLARKRKELAKTIQKVEEYKDKATLRMNAAKAKKKANTCSQSAAK